MAALLGQIPTQLPRRRCLARPARADKAKYFAARDCHRDILDNHFTVTVPGQDGRYLILPFGLHWSEARASDLIVFDESGSTLEGNGVVELSAQCIHAPIHRITGARVVLHTHQTWAVALNMLADNRLLPANQTALYTHLGGHILSVNSLRADTSPAVTGEPVVDKTLEVLRGRVDALGVALGDVDVAMPRGAVIAGLVVDEAGEPVTGASVTLGRYRFRSGARRLESLPVLTRRSRGARCDAARRGVARRSRRAGDDRCRCRDCATCPPTTSLGEASPPRAR